MADDSDRPIRWEKQAPAPDQSHVVNYSGSVAAGLRFESADGKAIALDSQALTQLFDTLRRYNPLWDGGTDAAGEGESDRLHQWLLDHVAGPWRINDTVADAARLHRVLLAEGLELPRIRPVDAVQACVGHEVLFFDRRNLCLARLTSVQRDDVADLTFRFEFELISLPELDSTHGSPFTVSAGEDFIRVNRGYFSILMTNVCVITARAIITDVQVLLTRECNPTRLITPIRNRLERRAT